MSDSKQKDGGPAFPFPSGPEPRVNEFHDRCEGMSLRAYLAGQAMLGLIATNACQRHEAVVAVEYADALIAELQQPGAATTEYCTCPERQHSKECPRCRKPMDGANEAK